MPKIIGLEIEGLPDLRKKLKKLPQKLVNEWASDGTLRAAEVVSDAVYATTPIDTGRLRRNIFAKKGDVKRKHAVRSLVMVYVGERTQKHNIMTGEFMSTGNTASKAKLDSFDSYYWWFVSKGTKYIKANPWIEDAAIAKADHAVDIVFEEIINGIQKDFTVRK